MGDSNQVSSERVTVYSEGCEGGIGTYNERLLTHLKKRMRVRNISPRKISFGARFTPIKELFLRSRAVQKSSGVSHFTDQRWLYAVPKGSEQVVVTVHDLAAKVTTYPDRISQIASVLHFEKIKSADAVITPSEATKRHIMNYTDYSAERIHKIPYGVDSGVFSPEMKDFSDEEWTKPYMLYVGALSSRKNIEGILSAFSLVREEIPDIELVMTGSEKAYVRSIMEECGIEDQVHFLGWVERENLAPLYSDCACFVFPTFFEGFGRPPAEAMACGAPVVVSDRTSLPEVVGDMAPKVNPTKPRAIADAVVQEINQDNPNKRKKRREYVKQKFNWERCVRETIRVYREVSM